MCKAVDLKVDFDINDDYLITVLESNIHHIYTYTLLLNLRNQQC